MYYQPQGGAVVAMPRNIFWRLYLDRAVPASKIVVRRVTLEEGKDLDEQYYLDVLLEAVHRQLPKLLVPGDHNVSQLPL